MNFIEKKISINKAIAILAKNEIYVDEEEATTILDFFYLMAKYYRINPESLNNKSLQRNRTLAKG